MRRELSEAVSDLIYDRFDREEFVRRTGIDPRREKDVIGCELRAALDAGSADDLHSTLTLGSMFDAITPELAPLLAGLLTEHWHVCHEDIARTLQDLRVPETVEALARAAVIGFDYLEYDDSHAFARKCCWALADIGTKEAYARLESLAAHPDATVAGYAQKRLDNWRDELARKGPGAYRLDD